MAFLLSSILVEESIDFVQIFNCRFLMDLHVLGCPEHVMTVPRKCLSVCMSVTKIFGKCSSRTNAQNLMKSYISCYPNVNWCLPTFGKNCSTRGAAVSLFPKFLGYADLSFFWTKLLRNLYPKYILIEVQLCELCTYSFIGGAYISRNSCDISISVYISWNRTKFSMLHIYFEEKLREVVISAA